ncbi:aldo/keto reductase [Kiloniella sp.]|uniref:aldo/keto reductase n=1 Tax=Kiloniella sp. TaxID=1938587 RepID=UPI003B0182FA
MENKLPSPAKRLALGTVQFGLPYGVANKRGQVSQGEAHQILKLARSHSLEMIDTAIGYGDSESCLGAIGVPDYKIVSKLPPMPEDITNIEEWVLDQVKASLNRLNVSQLHGLLLHRPLELLGANGQSLYNAMLEAQNLSLTRKIGISVYSPDELESLFAQFTFDLVQGPLNLIDRRLFESGWLSRLKERNVEIHTRSTFLQGLLLIPEQERPSKFSKWDNLWREWHQWLDINTETALKASVAYPLSLPEIDHVLVGADSVIQMQQILRALPQGEKIELPSISSTDELLINPANWPGL